MTEEKESKRESFPAPTFSQYIYALGMQVMIFTGKHVNPQTNKYEKNIDIAKYHIDLLEMLQEKTKGNLDEDENKLITELINNSRMAYLSEMK